MTLALHQPTLFGDDLHPAEASFYAAVAVHRGWYAAAEKAMAYLVNKGELFTADDLSDLLAEVTVEPPSRNAIGGLFMVWSRRGLIQVAGYQPSRQSKRNGGLNRVWQAVRTTKMDQPESAAISAVPTP